MLTHLLPLALRHASPSSHSVSACRWRRLISVGGSGLVERSEFIDFIDSAVQRFCCSSLLDN